MTTRKILIIREDDEQEIRSVESRFENFQKRFYLISMEKNCSNHLIKSVG